MEKMKPLSNEQSIRMMTNAVLSRRELMTDILNLDKDINQSCGYPDSISIKDYKRVYDREGVATRIATIFPQESWAMLPEVKENENSEPTTFETEWKALQKEKKVYHYLQRIDELSGIGEFGILLIGIDDGKELSEPVEGINELTGEKVGKSKHKLLYLRPFDQTVVKIKLKEIEVTSPRFGMPKTYDIIFQNEEGNNSSNQTKIVHWSRVIHVADNKYSSDVLGVPRLQTTYNRVLDIRKVVSGSAEMFWKGAFPGFALESDPDMADADFSNDDKADVKAEVKNYFNGLQRSMMFQGLKVKTLEPQVADPSGHLKAQIEYMAITLGIPLRIFTGSEQAQLASGQDMRTWNKRVSKRRDSHVTPWIIEPFIDRMIIFGVLSEVKEYMVIWPDLNTPTDEEKANVALKITEAIIKYVAGGGEALIGPKEFLMSVMGYEEEEAEAIEASAIEIIEQEEVNSPEKE